MVPQLQPEAVTQLNTEPFLPQLQPDHVLAQVKRDSVPQVKVVALDPEPPEEVKLEPVPQVQPEPLIHPNPYKLAMWHILVYVNFIIKLQFYFKKVLMMTNFLPIIIGILWNHLMHID